MTKHWSIDPRIAPEKMMVDGYHWDENGFDICFLDLDEKYNVQISFPVRGCGIRIFDTYNELESNDRIWHLMKAAGVDGPLNPFFISDTSELIEEVKKMARYDAEGIEYFHYTMYAHDFWIDIVSSEPPKITITDHLG